MGRVKTTWVSGDDAAKAVRGVGDGVASFLRGKGYVVTEGDRGWNHQVRLTAVPTHEDGASIGVKVESVRAAGYATAWTDIKYAPSARVTVEQGGPNGKSAWVKFDWDGRNATPAAGDGWERFLSAVQAATAKSIQVAKFRSRESKVFQDVKDAVVAAPVYRDILTNGLDVHVDTHGAKPCITVECPPDLFPSIWGKVREALHQAAGRCDCGEDIPFGWDRCADCAKGVTRPVDRKAALRVLPRFRLGFDERGDD
jgi:hypothetical protein